MTAQLSAEIISAGLKTRFVGRRLLYFPALDSTMDAARREARDGAAHGTAVVAGEQTGGRGRLSRTWHTPPGNIALSLVLRPRREELPLMVMMTSLAVVAVVKRVTGLKAAIKWPNDVQLSGKKVCGILMSSEMRGEAVDHVIAGIGLNVNLKTSDYPDIRDIATSLADETGREVSLTDTLRALLEEMERCYLRLPDRESIYEAWRDGMVTLGKRVSATWGETTYRGIAESVSPDGSLTLRQDDGSTVNIVAGDVALSE